MRFLFITSEVEAAIRPGPHWIPLADTKQNYSIVAIIFNRKGVIRYF